MPGSGFSRDIVAPADPVVHCPEARYPGYLPIFPAKDAAPMIELLVIVVCLMLNALLAGSEMAFVSASCPGIRESARQGDKRAHILLGLRESPERTLAVIQIGITLIAAVAGAVGGAGAEESLSPILAQYLGEGKALADFLAIGLVVLPLTCATVVIGELFPKSIALRNSLRLALYVAPVLQLLDR